MGIRIVGVGVLRVGGRGVCGWLGGVRRGLGVFLGVFMGLTMGTRTMGAGVICVVLHMRLLLVNGELVSDP